MAETNARLLGQIADRERAEGALRLNPRLEAVSRLTSSVPHDVSNLPTVIAGNIEFLERSVSDERSKLRLDTMRGASCKTCGPRLLDRKRGHH